MKLYKYRGTRTAAKVGYRQMHVLFDPSLTAYIYMVQLFAVAT